MELELRGEQWECPRCPLHPQPRLWFRGQIQSSGLIQRSVLFQKNPSLIPEVSHRLPAHCPSLQPAAGEPRSLVGLWLPRGLFLSLVWAGAPQQPTGGMGVFRANTLQFHSENTHTPDPSPQIQETQMEFKPGAPKQTKVHMHKLPWKLNNSYHKATEPYLKKTQPNRKPTDQKTIVNAL